jgi:surface antigen
MMLSKQMIAVLLALPLLTACESFSLSQQDVGTTTGAAPGGVVGHQVEHGTGQRLASVKPAALGAFLGDRLGTSMDSSDELRTAEALDTARNGEVTSWRNRYTHQRYSVRPIRTYDGQWGPCREFTTFAQLDDGRHRIAHGIACRQSDGTWKPV